MRDLKKFQWQGKSELIDEYGEQLLLELGMITQIGIKTPGKSQKDRMMCARASANISWFVHSELLTLTYEQEKSQPRDEEIEAAKETLEVSVNGLRDKVDWGEDICERAKHTAALVTFASTSIYQTMRAYEENFDMLDGEREQLLILTAIAAARLALVATSPNTLARAIQKDQFGKTINEQLDEILNNAKGEG